MFHLHSSRLPPRTRYQGSKRKLLAAIWEQVEPLPFSTALDAFGGTGCVSYLFKSHGKAVTFNDYLRANHLMAIALVENSGRLLGDKSVDYVLQRRAKTRYDDFIARTFGDIYFTDAENVWLDIVSRNIPDLSDKYERAIAYYALFQACIAKRPFNLFHRKNLYLRTADVRRSFGNKTTWDTPFEELFCRFVDEANRTVFDSHVQCKAICGEASDVPGDYDLVYIDPPYINGKGRGVDYFDFYHFLEGLTDYPGWEARLDTRRKHCPLQTVPSPWSDPRKIHDAFSQLFRRFADSILVVSYRSDGIPSPRELVELLRKYKENVEIIRLRQFKYVLSTNGKSEELLLIGR